MASDWKKILYWNIFTDSGSTKRIIFGIILGIMVLFTSGLIKTTVYDTIIGGVDWLTWGRLLGALIVWGLFILIREKM